MYCNYDQVDNLLMSTNGRLKAFLFETYVECFL